METMHIIRPDGCTFKDLIELVNECKENNLPLDTPIKAVQYSSDQAGDIADMQANEKGIIFYDWI